MRPMVRAGLVLVPGLLVAAGSRLAGQSTLTWAGPPLFILDVQGTPLDEFPNGVKALSGVMTTVDLNGQRMLMAASPSEFLITLPQVLPAAFTIILDIVPKRCCAPDDIMLEGTPTMNRGPASAQLTWQPERISAVGGSPDMYQAAMPDDLAASTPGNPTQLVIEFNGTTIKLYTNGRRLYTLDKQFARGRVLRVWLGGESATNPMYLAGLSVLSGAVAQGVIAANTGGQPSAGGSGGGVGGGASPNPQSRPQPTPPSGTSTSYVPPAPGSPSSQSVSPSGSSIVPPPPTGGTGSTGSTGSSSMVPTPPGSQTASQSQALTGSGTTTTMSPTVTQGTAGPVVQWAPLRGVTGYTVRRWKSDDLNCCNNSSAQQQALSPWQDAPITLAGVYVYEVTASFPTSSVVEQTQFTVVARVTAGPNAATLSAPPPASGQPAPATPSSTSTTSTSVVSAPIAAQTGTPVRTPSAPPPGSPAAAALAPTGPPPTNIAVTGTPVNAQLNWGSGISGMRGVTYKVDRWLESNPTCCAGQSATLSFPAWTDEGVQWSGTYVFQVTEFYPDGTWGQASTRWVRPDPVNPTNFRAASVSAGFVALRWDAVPNASWYELSGPGLGQPTFNATSGAYNVRNLAPGTYTWRVGTFYSSPNAPAPVSGPASQFPTVTVTVP